MFIHNVQFYIIHWYLHFLILPFPIRVIQDFPLTYSLHLISLLAVLFSFHEEMKHHATFLTRGRMFRSRFP